MVRAIILTVISSVSIRVVILLVWRSIAVHVVITGIPRSVSIGIRLVGVSDVRAIVSMVGRRVAIPIRRGMNAYDPSPNAAVRRYGYGSLLIETRLKPCRVYGYRNDIHSALN
jgi:hypothetical protein